MPNPKISIVMPSLNVAKYISVCLESVINQTLKDIEILCVDAGSTDGTLEIIKEYAELDNRITLIHSDKKSYGYQVNLGFEYATGDYFAIVETDDVINLRMYEILYNLAIKTGIDVIKADFCRFEVIDGVVKQKPDNIAKPHLYGRILTAKNDRRDIITNASLYTWSGIYKRTFLESNGIRHNESAGASYQDNGFWFQTMSMAQSVYFHNEQFYMLRRDNPNSSTKRLDKVYCIRDEYEFVLRYIKQHPDVYQELIPYYWWARFGAYRYNYNRIAPEYKWEFLKHFSDVFSTVWNSSELDLSLFSKTSYNDLTCIVMHPETYHKAAMRKSQRSLQKQTYLRRFIWVVEDHGILYSIKYSIKRVLRHFGYIDRDERYKRYIIRPITKHIDKKAVVLETKLDQLLQQNQKLLELLESCSEKQHHQDNCISTQEK